jgi:hypothetical protein
MYFGWGGGGFPLFNTSPHSSSSNQVERFTRNVKTALSILHNPFRTTWVKSLSYLSIDFNTAWHEAMRQTPATLFLGRPQVGPLYLRWERKKILQETSEAFSQASVGKMCRKFEEGKMRRGPKM